MDLSDPSVSLLLVLVVVMGILAVLAILDVRVSRIQDDVVDVRRQLAGEIWRINRLQENADATKYATSDLARVVDRMSRRRGGARSDETH